MTRAGIAALVGKPNSGKSTLLNRIIGQKLSITSSKPQSTRNRVVGIHTAADVQIVLADTPGLLNPTYALQRAMRDTAIKALTDADVIVYLCDAREGVPPALHVAAGLEKPPVAPVIVALSKIDRLRSSELSRLASEMPDAYRISALRGDGVAALVHGMSDRLPESPFLYPDEEVGIQPLRFFAAELVRETALEQLEDEVPYSVACEIEEFRESRNPVYIRAVVYVERESQKRILIGSGGSRIRDIGRSARGKIEELIGAPVYLDLWVKVLANWRRNVSSLQRFGYRISEEHGK